MKTPMLINLLILRFRTPLIFVALSLIGVSARAGEPKIVQEARRPLSDWLSSAGITGDWGGFRTELTNRGVDFFGSYEAEIWVNTTGGLAQGEVYTGLRKFGLNLDLQKATGWCGASLSTSWLWLSGNDPLRTWSGIFSRSPAMPDFRQYGCSNSGSSKICWMTESHFG